MPLVFPVRAVAKGVTHLETKGTPTLDKDLSEIGTFSRVHSGQAGGGPPPPTVYVCGRRRRVSANLVWPTVLERRHIVALFWSWVELDKKPLVGRIYLDWTLAVHLFCRNRIETALLVPLPLPLPPSPTLLTTVLEFQKGGHRTVFP